MKMPHYRPSPRTFEVLMIDDDQGDVMLTRRALMSSKYVVNLHVAKDGVEAMDYLRSTRDSDSYWRPDLILLDLNMPRMDGREVLAEIKQDADWRTIPLVVLTTSDSDEDVLSTYNLHANCYVSKPVDLNQFTTVVQAIKSFWFSAARLPS
jgi:chemotaxis family two-component system response regulator Rcp1